MVKDIRPGDKIEVTVDEVSVSDGKAYVRVSHKSFSNQPLFSVENDNFIWEATDSKGKTNRITIR